MAQLHRELLRGNASQTVRQMARISFHFYHFTLYRKKKLACLLHLESADGWRRRIKGIAFVDRLTSDIMAPISARFSVNLASEPGQSRYHTCNRSQKAWIIQNRVIREPWRIDRSLDSVLLWRRVVN